MQPLLQLLRGVNLVTATVQLNSDIRLAISFFDNFDFLCAKILSRHCIALPKDSDNKSKYFHLCF